MARRCSECGHGTARAEWFLNIVTKVRWFAWVHLRTRLTFIVPVAVRLTPLLKTDVAVTQFPDVHTVALAVKDILNKGVEIGT